MAEELALDEILWDGPAVDHDEGAVCPRTAAVEFRSDEFLARAGFPRDEYRDVGRGDLLQFPEDLHHRGAHADDFAEALVLQFLDELRLVGSERAQEQCVL